MRSRRPSSNDVADVARERLRLLSAELAGPTTPRSGRAPEDPAVDSGSDEPGGAAAGLADDRQAEESDPPRAAGLGLLRAGQPPSGVVAANSLPPGRHARRPVGAAVRAGGWMHDRLPPTLQGRVGLTPTHVTALAVMVAAGLALTAWWVMQSGAHRQVVAEPAAPASPSSSAVALVQALASPSAATGPAGGSSPAEPAEMVVVDVAGKVRRPGIASLPVGSRVVDAIEAAGGVRRGVDVTSLNLARVLVDGEQVLVGVPPVPGVAGPAASAAGPAAGGGALMVNLNTATQGQLEELPGVGPVTASAILQWRDEHGAFSAVDELLEVSGIGDATLSDLAPFVTL
jgi:competence protein ComEA